MGRGRPRGPAVGAPPAQPTPAGAGDGGGALTRRKFLGGLLGLLGLSGTAGGVVALRRGRPPATASWARDAVVYGAVPHLMGRDGFASVTRRLDELADLGVTALWLPPVTETATGDFGYDVADYRAVREDFGGAPALRDLITQAHQRDLRVIVDFVPNHTSTEHPWFRDAEELGRESATYGRYERDADGTPRHYFDWDHLPNLDYDDPRVRAEMTSAFALFARDFDVDGFRVDAAWGVQERRPDFFAALAADLRRVEPELLLLAEASVRDPAYGRAGFDAAYDWTDEIGEYAWAGVFTPPRATIPQRLDAAVAHSSAGAPALAFRALNTNDTEARFITRHGADLTRVAAAALLTAPGIPCVYTGDEVGAEYEPYETLDPIAADDPHGLRAHYRGLIAARRAEPALRSDAWVPVPVDAEGVGGVLRSGPRGEDDVLVLLNFTGADVAVTASLPEDHALGTGALRDVRDPGPVAAVRGRRVTAELEPGGVALLRRA